METRSGSPAKKNLSELCSLFPTFLHNGNRAPHRRRLRMTRPLFKPRNSFPEKTLQVSAFIRIICSDISLQPIENRKFPYRVWVGGCDALPFLWSTPMILGELIEKLGGSL